MITKKQITLIPVDAGDIVCFSVDSILHIMKKMGYDLNDYEEFLEDFDGVECGFNADAVYGVDKVTALDEHGQEYNAVLIGAPENCVALK